MGAGSFFAGLAKGFAGEAGDQADRKQAEEKQRRNARLNIITTALPHLPPELQGEALALADEFATGKSKPKGGLSEIFGPLIGKIQPRDEGQSAKLQEFLTRPREAVVAPASQTAPNTGALPSKPVVTYLPDVPGVSFQYSDGSEGPSQITQNPAPTQFSLDPLPIPAKTATVRGPFMTPAEKVQEGIAAKTAQMAATEPFQERAEARKWDYTRQIHELDLQGRAETARITALARAAGTQHSVKVHKDGGAPWEYVERRVNNLGQVVNETPVDAPAAIMRDYHTAAAVKKPGETIEQAYSRVLQLDQEHKDQVIKNLKGAGAERAQRMHRNARMETLRDEVNSGKVTSPQQARLALSQLREEVGQRRRDHDDPIKEMPYEQAVDYVAKYWGVQPERLQHLRDLSLGQAALPPVPGTGNGAAAAGQPPAEAVAQMPVGQPVTFKNGQTWQKDANGRVARVK